MKKIIPGLRYVYERADGITYARLVGDPPSERFEINRDHQRIVQDEHSKWREIIEAAQDDNILKKELERVKVLYHLRKNKDKLWQQN